MREEVDVRGIGTNSLPCGRFLDQFDVEWNPVFQARLGVVLLFQTGFRETHEDGELDSKIVPLGD